MRSEPACRQTPELSNELEQLFQAAEDLGDNPNTLLALRDLRKGVQITRPALELVAPYQTVCNNLVYFFNPLGTHQSAAVAGGTSERILAKLVDTQQANSLGSTESKKPVDIPTGQTGYPYRLATNPRWPGGHLVVDPDTPGLAGGTFKSRELGVNRLEDVP